LRRVSLLSFERGLESITGGRVACSCLEPLTDHNIIQSYFIYTLFTASVASILAAARAVKDTTGGVLFIVKNYTGDRLNHGMAVEKANLEGIEAAMVVVADDCALPREKGITGSRGVAGK